MKKGRTKQMIYILAAVILGIALVFGGIVIYTKHQMAKIPELSFEEVLEYTTKDNSNAVITVGIIKNGQISYKVYGENGKELSDELHTYEIGSLTKTFTASLINVPFRNCVPVGFQCIIVHFRCINLHYEKSLCRIASNRMKMKKV